MILFCKGSFIVVYRTNYRHSHHEMILNQPFQQNVRKISVYSPSPVKEDLPSWTLIGILFLKREGLKGLT